MGIGIPVLGGHLSDGGHGVGRDKRGGVPHDVWVDEADGVPAVGFDAAHEAEADVEGVVHEGGADDDVGKEVETDIGTAEAVPCGHHAGMDLEALEDEVKIRIDADDVAGVLDGVGCGNGVVIGQREGAVVGILRVVVGGVALPHEAQIGNALMLFEEGETVVGGGGEIEVEFAHSVTTPEVVESEVGLVAQLVDIGVETLGSRLPSQEVVDHAVERGRDGIVGEGDGSGTAVGVEGAVGEAVEHGVVVGVVEVGGELDVLFQYIFTEEGEVGGGEMVGAVVGGRNGVGLLPYPAPRRLVEEACSVVEVLATRGMVVEVGHGGPVVAEAETQVVVVEALRGFGDFDVAQTGGRKDGGDALRGDGVAEGVLHGLHGVDHGGIDVEFERLLDDGLEVALHIDTFVVGGFGGVDLSHRLSQRHQRQNNGNDVSYFHNDYIIFRTYGVSQTLDGIGQPRTVSCFRVTGCVSDSPDRHQSSSSGMESWISSSCSWGAEAASSALTMALRLAVASSTRSWPS